MTAKTNNPEAEAEAAEPTQEYIVTQKNTLDYKVGQKVKLTDSMAKALVNKVRLASEMAQPQPESETAKQLKDAEAKIKKLEAELAKVKKA